MQSRGDTWHIERARLTEVVRGTPLGGICLMVAPRGYGASTAVRDAVAGDRVLWVEVTSALPVTDALRSALGLGRQQFGAREIRQALEKCGAAWIVLDGVVEDPPAWLMRALRDCLPDQARLVLAGCLTWEGVLRDFPADTLMTREQLEFTLDESRQLLDGVSGVSSGHVDAAVEWCEGWALALKVAAARLRHHSAAETDAWMVGEGADALVAPWLDALTEEQRGFLIATALLDEIEVGAANAVCQCHHAGSVLADLTKRPGLLWRLPPTADGVVRWHRHRLLTEVLRGRAPSGGERREAHARAAAWYQEQGRVEAAVSHLLEAGRKAEAGELLRRFEGGWLAHGDARKTLSWYRQLSPEGWAESAEHWFRLGWGNLLSGNPQGARESLVHLAALAQAIPAQEIADYSRSWFEGNVAVLEAKFAAFTGDVATMADKSARARQLFGPDTTANSQQLAPIDQALGLLWQGNVNGARSVLSDVDAMTYPNAVMREVVYPGVDALCAWTEGRVRYARHMVARAYAWLDDSGPGLDARALGPLDIARSLVTAEAGDLPTALELISTVVESSQARGHVSEATAAMLARARILLWAGDPQAARAELEAAREDLLLSCPTSAMVVLLDEMEALALLRLGEGARAERLIRRLPNSPQRDLLAMRLLSAAGAAPAARALTAMRPSTPRLAALRRLQLAEYFLGRDEALVRSHLYAAGNIAHEHDMNMLLRDYPALRGPARSAAKHAAHDGLSALVFDTATTPQARPRLPEPQVTLSTVQLPVALSQGERRLLELLPTRSTNADIAAQLGVSLNTVKTRLQRLYRKLGVSSRDAAVAAVAQHTSAALGNAGLLDLDR